MKYSPFATVLALTTLTADLSAVPDARAQSVENVPTEVSVFVAAGNADIPTIAISKAIPNGALKHFALVLRQPGRVAILKCVTDGRNFPVPETPAAVEQIYRMRNERQAVGCTSTEPGSNPGIAPSATQFEPQHFYFPKTGLHTYLSSGINSINGQAGNPDTDYSVAYNSSTATSWNERQPTVLSILMSVLESMDGQVPTVFTQLRTARRIVTATISAAPLGDLVTITQSK